jgi:hypothetical protein
MQFYSNQQLFKPLLRAGLMFLLMVMVNFTLSGQAIATWDFAGLSSPATAAATAFDANLVTAGNGNLITRGAGAAASSASNSFRTTGFQNNGISTANTDYFQITLTAQTGYKISLNSIDARVAGTATFTAAPNGCQNQFAYSVDGINFTLIGTPSISTATPTQLPTINLSGIGDLQNVLYTSTIYLRFYASGQTATGGWGFNSLAAAGTPGLSIGGTVASAGPLPTMATSGSLTALSTTYGTASTTSTIDVSGSDMNAGITVTAPTGFEVSDNSSTGFGTSTLIGAAGTIPLTPVYIRLAATTTVPGSPYSGNLQLTSLGAGTLSVAMPPSDVIALAISSNGATAQSKVYDGNDICTISGATPSTSVNGDIITLVGNGIFDNKNIGIGKTVTAYLSVSGTNASSYTLTQPTLTADISAAPLSITGALALNKIFDGNDDATITGTLSGVISPDVVGFVGYGNFAQSSVGTAIPVTAACSLNGADAGNYSLTQPTGLFADITPPGLTPQTITFSLSSPVTYGDGPFTLNGVASSGLTVSYTSSDPTVASVSGNLLTLLKDGTVTITAQQPGDFVNYSPATDVPQTLTIDKKTLTVLNPVGDSKNYDKTTAATFTGTLDGVVGSDNVVLNATGTFPQSIVGTGLTITSTATLSGSDVSKYIFIQPSGMTGDINPKPLTLDNPIAKNKIFDGTTTATITGTLNGVISPDAVFVTLSATFASSAIGNGIAVTSTSILGGVDAGNYSLTQPAGLLANIYPVPTITEDILPQYMQGVNGTNANRIPYAYRVTISNLLPNATYRYYNTVVVASDLANSNGAGNIIFVSPSGYTRTTSPSLNTAGAHSTFVTDATGNYSGWFVTEPSGNATRFIPGNNVFMRIMLNDGEGGTTVSSRVTTSNSAKVINLVAAAGPNNGTGLRGNSNALDKNFVIAYDNVTGTGRPISGTYVENDGTIGTTINSYASFYSTSVDGVAGAYGMVIPNDNANGIQRLEQRSLADGSLVGCANEATGIWPGGANTVNPTGGTTAQVITITDAPLNNCGVNLNVTLMMQGFYIGGSTMNSALLNQGVAGATATDCDSVIVELHDATTPFAVAHSFTGVFSTSGVIACTFPGSAAGNSYYVGIRNRNSIETWSANPVLMSSNTSYNFTTDANQAFGDNQVEVETGVFAFYSGDFNQDYAIDGLDYILQDPDVIAGSVGYLATDITGDGTVDAFDYITLDPNVISGITAILP